MNDRDEIKERVKRAVDLAQWVERDGVPLNGGPREFKGLCPFHPDRHPSLTVFEKDGAWFYKCFGCGASGDVFEWVMRRKGIDFKSALESVANAVGTSLPGSGERIYQPASANATPRQAEGAGGRGAFDGSKYRPMTYGSAAYEYLTRKRKLDPGLLEDYGVGETADGLAYAFKYQWQRPVRRTSRCDVPTTEPKPHFEFLKVVRVERDERGKKVEWRDPKGGTSILFGMLAPLVVASRDNVGELVICEGEIDAISWAQYGYAAVSVPGGAGYTGWIETCFEWLAPFSKLHISFDEDAAGRLKLVEVVTRLGMARTDMVRLPEILADSHQEEATV